MKLKIDPFEKIVDQIRGVFKLGGRFGGPPDKVPPGGEGLFPESVPTRFETVATPLLSPYWRSLGFAKNRQRRDSVQYLIWRCGLVCYRFVYSGIATSGCETSRVQTVRISALGSYHRC